MTAPYFWMCTQGCTWRRSDDYQAAIQANGSWGNIASFAPLNIHILLRDSDVFCMFALFKNDLYNDIYSQQFALTPAPAPNGQNLFIWGHHAGGSGRYFLTVVTDGSAIHTTANMRPDSWVQKGGPYPRVNHVQIRAVLDTMS